MKGIQLFITHRPLLKDFVSAIRKQLYIFHMNDEDKKTIIFGPMILAWEARKFGSYFVSAKPYPLERSVGSFKCNGKCLCSNVTETKAFSNTIT